MNNSNNLEPSFSSLVYKDWYCNKKTTKLFYVVATIPLLCKSLLIWSKKRYIADGVMGVMLVQCQSLFTKLAKEKK